MPSPYLLNSNSSRSQRIGSDCYQRIKCLANKVENVDETNKSSRTCTTSAERAKNWPNTLTAQREKKKQDAIKKRQIDEDHHRELDARESAYQEAQRKIILDRANRILYSEKDEVKNFQSGVMLAHVIKCRENQIASSLIRSVDDSLREKEFVSVAEENRLSLIREEKELEVCRSAARSDLAKAQQSQLSEHRRRLLLAKQEEIAEGQRIAAQQEILLQELRLAEEQKQSRQRSLAAAYRLANDIELQRLADRKVEEESEEAKIFAFALKHEERLNKRKESEELIRREKAARSELLLERQFAHLLSIKNEESNRLASQVAAEQEKKEAAEQNKIKFSQLRMEEIKFSREQSIKRKINEKLTQAAKESAMIRSWNLLGQQEKEAEEKEKQNKNTLARQVADIQKQQIKEKEMHKLNSLTSSISDVITREESEKREERVFQHYVSEKLSDMKDRGFSLLPMKLALEKQAKLSK